MWARERERDRDKVREVGDLEVEDIEPKRRKESKNSDKEMEEDFEKVLTKKEKKDKKKKKEETDETGVEKKTKEKKKGSCMAEDSPELIRANGTTLSIINDIIEGGADATLVGNVLRSLQKYNLIISGILTTRENLHGKVEVLEKSIEGAKTALPRTSPSLVNPPKAKPADTYAAMVKSRVEGVSPWL